MLSFEGFLVCLWKHSRILCGYLYSWTRSHPIVSADVGMTTVVRREPARPVDVLGRRFCPSRRISSARGGGPRVQSVGHDVQIQAGGYQSPQVVCCAALLSGGGCRMRWCDGVIECRCQAERHPNLTIDTMRTMLEHQTMRFHKTPVQSRKKYPHKHNIQGSEPSCGRETLSIQTGTT